MATFLSIGFDKSIDGQKAAQIVANTVKTQLNPHPINLAVILSSIHYDPQEFLPIIAETLATQEIIGYPCAGMILNHGIETRGLALLAISSDEIRFGISSSAIIDETDARAAGVSLAKNSFADLGSFSRGAFLLFINGLIKNNSSLLKGLQEIFGNIFPVLGAINHEGFHLKESFQIYRRKIINQQNSLGLMIGGHVNIALAARHGWKPLGKPRFISKTEGNIIKLIDNVYAYKIYEEYLGKEIKKLYTNSLQQPSILYPLGIKIADNQEYLLRNAIDILADGSILCQGDVPEGAEVHIMIGNKDFCKKAALEACHEVKKQLSGKKPKLIFVIESLTRLKLLGRLAGEEIQLIKSVFGNDVPIFGLYSQGEIASFESTDGIKRPHVLNESIVILGIS